MKRKEGRATMIEARLHTTAKYKFEVFLIQVPSKYRDIDISHMKLFENIE
jgi:hypothetical protein